MCTRSWPTKPEIDEMLTMAPPPASRMAGTAYFMPRKTPLAFTLISASQAAVLVMSGSNVPLIPALLTTRSSLPNPVTATVTAFCQSASLVTSSFTKRAWPPAAAIFSTTWRASNSSTSPTTTRAPSRAKIVASLCPIPLAPPVISATFPASLILPLLFHRLFSGPPAGAERGAGAGGAEKDPFPHRGDGRRAPGWSPAAAGKRTRAAWSVRPLPRSPPRSAPAGAARRVSQSGSSVYTVPPAEARLDIVRRAHGDVCAGSRRVSGRLDLEAGRGPAASRGASGPRAHARRLRRAPRSGAVGDHGRHARAGSREAPLLRGPRAGDPRGDELGRHGDLQSRRAGTRPDRAARLRRRAGADVRRVGRRHREARGAQRHDRDDDGTHAGGCGEAPLRRSRPRHPRLGPGALYAASGRGARGARRARQLLEPGVADHGHPLPTRHEPARIAPASHGRAAQGRLARARHRPLSDAQSAGAADAFAPGPGFLTGTSPRCTVPLEAG